MKFFKKNTIFGAKERNNSISVLDRLSNRLAHVRRKIPRGAANIYRMIKTRSAWGNKQLWGNREKGKK